MDMSNIYDLETDIEVEDVASEEEEDVGYTYQSQEDELEDTEFGRYDPEEAAARWGGMEFDQLISEMEGYVSRSKKYFFSKKRIVVDGKEINTLVKHIQGRFPQEIMEANAILDKETTIINDAITKSREIIATAKKTETETVDNAKKYYMETYQRANEDKEKLIAEGKAEQRRLVQEHEITRNARIEAERIRVEAQRQLDEYKASVIEDCENAKRQATEYCNQYCDWVERTMAAAHNFILTSLKTTQDAQLNHLAAIEQISGEFCDQYQQTLNKFLSEKQ